MKQIRTIDIAIFDNFYVYVDGHKYKRKKFKNLNEMINSLKKVCSRDIKSDDDNFTDVIYEKYGGSDYYLFCFKVFADKEKYAFQKYAFHIIGVGVGVVSKLYSSIDELFDDLKRILKGCEE